MSKAQIKNLLIDKGEKYLLIGAGAFMLLLAILGVMEIAGKPNPDEFVREVDTNTSSVTSAINGASNSKVVPELPPETSKKPPIDSVKSTLWPNHLFFDPIAPPDKRRINPIVLGITEIQADFLWAKILAYDILDADSGDPKVAVIKYKPKGDAKIDSEQTKALFSNLRDRTRPTGVPLPKKNENSGTGAVVESGPRLGVEYVSYDPEKFKDYRVALTIYPQRMVVVQAAFPYKAQVEEIQKALRLQDPMEVFDVYKPEDVPYFRGFAVQRQVLSADGKSIESAWSDLDVQSPESTYAKTIQQRLYANKDEDPNLQYVLLHGDHDLTVQLPMLLTGKYPELRLPTLLAAIKRLQDLRKPPAPQKAPSQFTGGASMFRPIKPNSAGTAGQPGTGADGINIPKAGIPGKEGDPASGAATFEDKPDQVLVRFIDNDIIAGRLYQYRIKVRMQNPNWAGPKDKKDVAVHKEKYDLVSRPSDADVELIEGPWTSMENSVSVPREEFLFAADPVDSKKSDLKVGQGMLQIQRWMPVASVGAFKEPVADWIVADVVATRGTYLGGKQFVNLPIWASEYNRYILREAPGKKEIRHGVVMDPTKPGPAYVVVEVDGGLRKFQHTSRTVTEETAADVLLLDEGGGLQVRSSYADRSDPGRVEREKTWREWIKRTEEDTKSLVPEAAKGPANGFN